MGNDVMATNKTSTTLLCTVLHLLVDGLCVCCLYMTAGGCGFSSFADVFITYNVLAFLTQPLTGLVADHVHRQSNILILTAVALLSTAVFVASTATLFHAQAMGVFFCVAILLGMGNSLFHVWGGKRVACITRNDIRALGVFVATGALGLAIGVVFASWLLLYGLLLAITLATWAVIRIPDDIPNDSSGSEVNTLGKSWWTWGAILLLMGFVCLRSFLGESLIAGVTKGSEMILLIGGLAMLGKGLGGWVAKGIGPWPTIILALAGTLFCLWLKSGTAWLWIPGVLLINLTMAVTLYWGNRVLPGREGLAFGLLAASLMPGYLLAQLSGSDVYLAPLMLRLILTVAIEVWVLWRLREKRPDVLWSAVVVNILTNLPLNLCLIYVGGGWAALLVGEILVILAEAVWYRFFTSSWKLGITYSLLCNAISFLCGVLAQLTIILINIIL